MINKNNIKKLIQFFFFGMSFQFIVHTIVVYGFHIPDTGILGIIRIRKEIMVLGLGVRASIVLYKDNNLFNDKRLLLVLGCVSLSFIVSILNSLIIHGQGIGSFLMSAKFSYFPLIIGCVSMLIGKILSNEDKKDLQNSIIQNIKIVLLFSLGRYVLLHTFANGLDWIGYAQPGESIEWSANTPPPSLRLTEFYTGYVRNQGPFGGPLSLGFYLACLRPFFFTQVLYKKKLSDTRGRRVLYISMIISTFSRASRIMFLVINGLISLVIYRKYAKHIILGGVFLISVLGSYLYLGGKSELFLRTWSDSGHKEYITEGVQMIKKNLLRGMGAGSVGPASYHTVGEKAFNPENQYMQIWLEYGLLGAIVRFLSYIVMFKKSMMQYRLLWTQKKQISIEGLSNIIPVLGFVGLCIASIVLHPMTDSSSIYPFMMLSGLLVSDNMIKEKKETDSLIINTNLTKNTKILRPYFRKGLRIMTTVWGLFFVIQTLLVSSLHLFSNTITISILRDGFSLGIVITSIILYKKQILPFLQENKFILILLLGLFSIPLFHIGSIESNGLLSFIAGMKFDIHYLFILLGGLRLGFLVAYEQQEKELISYIQRLIQFALILILGGILWQGAKNIRPDFFVKTIGMSLPRDFIPFNTPPIYYITGPGGIQRLSGFFVGPNTLGFFLITLCGLLRNKIKSYNNKLHLYSITVLLLLCLFTTFSRAAVIGITIEVLIMIYTNSFFIQSQQTISHTKKIISILIALMISTICLVGINHWKISSNMERKASLKSSLSFISEKSLLGYGPGFVGPGRHYDSNYLSNPKNNNSMIENTYLQIFINEGIIGFLLRCGIWIYLTYIHRICNKNNNGKKNEILQYFNLLGLGLIGLLSIGLFLHVFIDSMVNYIFWTSYGLLLGYNTHNLINRNNLEYLSIKKTR